MPVSLRAITFSRGIGRIPGLAGLLGVEAVLRRSRYSPFAGRLTGSECVVGWGNKRNTDYPRQYAARHGLPYLTLEDGFLRSIGLGLHGDPPLSVVIDDLGIYYDATRPSRLEVVLNGAADALHGRALPAPIDEIYNQYAGEPLEDPSLQARARRCIAKITESGLSKYNNSPDTTLPAADRPRVLVVDQTAGDLSIECGLASADSFQQMLEAALAEHPQSEILVKVHPDVVAGKKRGHLLAAGNIPRVRLLDQNINPLSLIRQVDHVYVVTSLTGFEALMLGKAVTCFGAPFYAGWGLTEDRINVPRRARQRSLEQVFAAAYLLYARYRDPETGAACEIERVIDHLALQRHWFERNAGDLYCYGFSLWKRGYARSYLRCPWNRVHFIRTPWRLARHQPADTARLVVWGVREPARLRALAKARDIPVWRVEDGFLRSVGLGSDLTAPASWVVDRRGIYFDPAQPSDLEFILENTAFSEEDRAMARTLKNTVVSHGLSKYNVDQSKPLQHQASPGQRVILVPGQVETDASIRRGCVDIRTNARLLREVREHDPQAYIIYKPHPDVLSGNRDGVGSIVDKTDYDLLIMDVSIVQCLDAVDEVHTMTSLVGFEGLLRGKRVVTYGQPFYAGWGLTEDRAGIIARRTRRLDLDELVAGCLLAYPCYLSVATGRFTTVDKVIEQLKSGRAMMHQSKRLFPQQLYRTARRLRNLVSGLFYAR